MRRSLLHKLHYFIRILQLIATFKIDHNFSCEIIYVLMTATVLVISVEIFRLGGKARAIVLFASCARNLRWYLTVMSVRAS